MKKTRGTRSFAAALAAALLAAVAGCDTLPEGDPPAGPLTDNSQPPISSPQALRNHLVTQLIMFALSDDLESIDPGSDPETVSIAAEAARTAGFTLDRRAPLLLRLVRGKDGTLDLTAIRKSAGGEVWRSRRP